MRHGRQARVSAGAAAWRPSRCLLLLFALAAAARSEILDRVAVSVGNRVITAVDLDREIRLTALLNGARPDFTPSNKRQTAERMVDQRLVGGELEASRYSLPSAAEGEAALQDEKSRFPDEAAYRRALAEYGVTEDELKARLVWQLTLVRFIDIRFRPGIQISEDEIRKYFDAHVRTLAAGARPGPAPTVNDYRGQIEQVLTSQAANQQVDQWLREARRRTRIQYHDEVFQ